MTTKLSDELRAVAGDVSYRCFLLTKPHSIEGRYGLWVSKLLSIADRLDKESGWRPIESAPDDGVLVAVYWNAGDGEQLDFDRLDDGVWQQHFDNYEHFIACAPAGSVGPSEQAPYTHWMPLPPPPKE